MELLGGESSTRGRTSSLTFSEKAEGCPEEANEGSAEIMLATETFRRKSRRGMKDSAMSELAMKIFASVARRRSEGRQPVMRERPCFLISPRSQFMQTSLKMIR